MTKKTISQIVKECEVELKIAANHTELRTWAIEKGFDNRSAFPKFKNALLEISIDYAGMKGITHQIQEQDIENQIEHALTLYTDAKASYGNFAICDKNGDVLWYGKFFPEDNAGEQSRAEVASAKKAVWLASKVKEAIGGKPIYLNLIVDAQWLCYQDHSGQKGYVLTQAARKYGIKLDVTWIKGTENPADEYTTAKGFKKWQDNDLTKLCEPYKIEI
jgi:hypothetical protein